MVTCGISVSTYNICGGKGTIAGCTNNQAHNYSPLADCDDGSCLTCSDNIKNGEEIFIDCAGSLCISCNCLYDTLLIIFPIDQNQTFHAIQNITSSDSIHSNLSIIYKAGADFDFLPGFNVPQTTNLEVIKETCPE